MSSQQPANYSTFAYAYHKQVMAAAVAFPVLGTFIVVLRFLTRLTRKSGLKVDDWLMLPALLCIIGMGACLIAGVEKRVMGYPTPPRPDSNPEAQAIELLLGQGTLELLEWVFLRLMILEYGFIKLSVIFFYRRVFVTNRWSVFDIITKISTVIIVMWTTGFFLANVFGCGRHFAWGWGPLEDEDNCVDSLVELEALMITDFITDLFVIGLPFPLIWRLHMKTSRKFAVTGVFLLGASSLGASIARMVLQIQLSIYGYTTKTDIFLTITTILYWSMIEAGLAIIACCLPTLQSLITKDSAQSLIASVRSMVSLHSIRSHSSGVSKTSSPRQQPYTELGRFGSSGEDTVALTDIEKASPIQKPANVYVES